MLDIIKISRKAALSVIFNDKNQVLLLMRNDMPLWELVGGVVEEGESHEEALSREAIEEVGNSVEIVRFLGDIYSERTDISPASYRHFRFYQSKLLSDQIILDEHIAYEWFAQDNIPWNIAPIHRIALDHAFENDPPFDMITDALDGKNFSKILIHEKTYGYEEWKNHPKVIAKCKSIIQTY